jgi:hypothetical protein
MSSLSLSAQPGFTDIPGSSFASGQPVTAAVMQALNSNAKYGAVRNEQFWGFYRNGETVQLPVSPVDGYQYSREELLYSWSIWYTGPAVAPCNGSQAAPTTGQTSGQGTLLYCSANVDQTSGLVTCSMAYYKTSQMNVPDGVLMVITHACRNR